MRRTRAFSSEVGTGSRKENASNQESRAPFRFHRNGKGSSPFRTIPSTAGINPWLLHLATRTLAYALNLPEPLLHTTGVFVLVRVQAAENSLSHALCPFRLMRQLRSLIEAWRRRVSR